MAAVYGPEDSASSRGGAGSSDEEEAAMESEESNREDGAREDVTPPAAAASATQREYAELVAGLLQKPEASFAASSLDLLQALRQEQQQLSRQQQELGSQQLKTQWLPLMQQLQQLQLQEQQRGPEQQQQQGRHESDRVLLLRCLHTLQEDSAAWERQAKAETYAQRGGSSSNERQMGTAELLQQLAQKHLFHSSGRLFTAVDADAEVWTSSDDNEEQEQQQHESGRSSSSTISGKHSSSSWAWGEVADEHLRFPAPVLPLRAALRGVRRQQRNELQVKQLLLEWSQPHSRLQQLRQVAGVWAEDGLFSAARAAGAGQPAPHRPTQQQRQHQQPRTEREQQPQEDAGGQESASNIVAHALAELRQVEQLAAAKSARRELRAWKAAAVEVFGRDLYGGLEQLLQSAAVAAVSTSARREAAVPAALALLPEDEQQLLLRLLRQRWVTPVDNSANGLAERQQQEQRMKQKKLLTAEACEGTPTTKKAQDKAAQRVQQREALETEQHLCVAAPPACFFSHGLEELRCVSCRVWLTQTQQLLQLQQEGACSALLQPVQTRLVKQLLLLQQEQRLQRVLGGRQAATAGAAAAAAAAAAGPHGTTAAAASAQGRGAAAAMPAAARAAAHADERETENTGDGFEIVNDPEVGASPHAEKLYVGHLGMLYTTVWGGGYRCGPHTSELLMWLRLLQPFQPLHLRRDGPPRSRDRRAQQWQLLQEAYYRSGVLRQQQQQQPFYMLPFKNLQQQHPTKKAKNALPLYKSLYARALQRKDKILLETDADSSETEGEARERRRLAAVHPNKQLQTVLSQRKHGSKGATPHTSFSTAAADSEMEAAARSGKESAEATSAKTATTSSGSHEACEGRVIDQEGIRLSATEAESASDEEDIGVSRYLKYVGKGFVHVNRAWMHKPFRRRRLPLPLPRWRVGDAATACAGKYDTDSSGGGPHGGLKTAGSSSSGAQEYAAAASSGKRGARDQHRSSEKAAAEAAQQLQPLQPENEEFWWTVELSSSEDSVTAYQEGAARYRRRYRVWRRRQRQLRARRLQQQHEICDHQYFSSPREANRAAGDVTDSAAAALAAAGDPGGVDELRHGHALEDFLKRLGGMSYSRYSQLAATAAAGAAAAAAAARKQLLRGRLKRRRGESKSSSSRSGGPSAEQRAAALQLQQLRPRKVWGWHWAVETAGEEEEEEQDEEGGGPGFMHMLSLRRKLYRMRRKPRTRAVEPSWDPHLQQRFRRKRGPPPEPPPLQRRWQLQQPCQQQEEPQDAHPQRHIDEDAADTGEASPRVFPFGMAATGWWGPSRGITAAAPDSSQAARAGKGREVQFICVDENELHTRMGKTKLYQERFEGLEDELASRREYYAVIDEENRRIHVVPAGRLSFFVTETPRQVEHDFMEQLFGDLRRNARGSLLETLLLKRRSARNVLLMNAMLWQSQLKHLNQIRLCRLLGGFWHDAAFAGGDAPMTEQQLLEDFLSVNARALHVLEAEAGGAGPAGSVPGTEDSAAAARKQAYSQWAHAAAALEDRWSRQGQGARDGRGGDEIDSDDGVNYAERPLIDAAAQRMRVPRAALRLIDQAATDAGAVAALAVAAADHKSQRE